MSSVSTLRDKGRCYSLDRLILPQLEYCNPTIKNLSEVILIAGGRKPNVDWFNEVKMDRSIYCIDRGIDFCREIDRFPELLIGDFDSAEIESVQWALDKGVKIERHSVDKDLTDTQLALNRVNDNSFAILTGVFGGRLDHLFSILFTCANSQIKSCLTDERETVLFVSSGESIIIEFKTEPLALSLLPISNICKGVTIDGVHWSLQHVDLTQSIPSAISNRVESKTVNISVKEGKLAVYLCFAEYFAENVTI